MSLLFGVWYFQQQTVQPLGLYPSYEQIFAEKEQDLASLNQALFTEIVDKSLSFKTYKKLETNALSTTTATKTLVTALKKFVQKDTSIANLKIEEYQILFNDFQQVQFELISDYRARNKLQQQIKIKNINRELWSKKLPKESEKAAALLLAYQARIIENTLLNYYNRTIGLANHNPTLCSWAEPMASAVRNEIKRGESYKADIVLGAWCRIPKQHKVMINEQEIKPEDGHYYFIQTPESVGKYAVNVKISTNVMNEEIPQFFEKTFEYEVVK